MIAEHFTRRWQQAGLIEADLAQRILAWETAHRRPVFLWAIAGMGTLAVGLGILAIVGANWEDIPGGAKLAVDLGLTALCAVAVFVFWRRDKIGLRETASLLLFGLVLSGIALIGQVYQLQSDPWRALLLWLALCTPFLALTAQSRLSGALWAIAAVTTWFAADAALQSGLARLGVVTPHRGFLDTGYLLPLLAYLAACGMMALAALRGLWPPARAQAALLLQLALAGMIAVCSLALAFDWRSSSDGRPLGPILVSAAATAIALLVLQFGSAERERRLVLALVAGSFIVWVAALLVSGQSGKTGDILRVVLFVLYWGAIGGVAAVSGRRGLFGLAFTMIGLRLLVVYFEAIGGLTETGFGLIGGGLLCFLLAALGWQLTRKVARRPQGGATA
ncbi:hypothetical protein BH11PSE3_BH11PSE3_16460 [soil metagenome]